MSEKDEVVPTVGYHPAEGAKTFSLKRGEKLPAGYSDAPHPGQHPHEIPGNENGMRGDPAMPAAKPEKAKPEK